MANTKTSKTVIENTREAVIHFTLASDGTQETNTVIYDSDVIASAIGISDPLSCSLLGIDSVASLASAARVQILFDASTPVLATTIPNSNAMRLDWQKSGGAPNTGGAGKTGDITITTTGLSSGDLLMVRLRVRTS